MPDGGGFRILGIPELFMKYYSLNLIGQFSDFGWVDRRSQSLKQTDKSLVRRLPGTCGRRLLDDLLVSCFPGEAPTIVAGRRPSFDLGPAGRDSVSGTLAPLLWSQCRRSCRATFDSAFAPQLNRRRILTPHT